MKLKLNTNHNYTTAISRATVVNFPCDFPLHVQWLGFDSEHASSCVLRYYPTRLTSISLQNPGELRAIYTLSYHYFLGEPDGPKPMKFPRLTNITSSAAFHVQILEVII